MSLSGPVYRPLTCLQILGLPAYPERLEEEALGAACDSGQDGWARPNGSDPSQGLALSFWEGWGLVWAAVTYLPQVGRLGSSLNSRIPYLGPGSCEETLSNPSGLLGPVGADPLGWEAFIICFLSPCLWPGFWGPTHLGLC